MGDDSDSPSLPPPPPDTTSLDLTNLTISSPTPPTFSYSPNHTNVNLHLLNYKSGLNTFYFPKSDSSETTDRARGTHVWRAVEGFFNNLDVSSDSDASLFLSEAVPVLEDIMGIPDLEEQEGPMFHRPLTRNQRALVSERIAGLNRLIERSRRQATFTPEAHASEILGEDVREEDEEFILKIVETEFDLAQGLVDASRRLREKVEKAVSRRTKGTTGKN